MFCPKCGTSAEDHYRYCSKCGAELSGVAQPITSSSSNMSTHVTILGWLFMVSGVLTGVLGAAIMVVARMIPALQLDRMREIREVPVDLPKIITLAGFGIGLATIAIAVGTFMAGYGLLQYRPWARVLAIIAGILGIIHFPLGTALGIYALWALLSEAGRQHYDSMAPRDLVRA